MNTEKLKEIIEEASEVIIDIIESFDSEADALMQLKDLFVTVGATNANEYIEKVKQLQEETEDVLLDFVTHLRQVSKNLDGRELTDDEVEDILYSLVALKNTLEEIDAESDEAGEKILNLIKKVEEAISEEYEKPELIEEEGNEEEEMNEEPKISEVKESSSGIKIISPKEKVSDKAQIKVDKEKLKNDLMTALEENVPGAKEALYEIFALVKCEDKKECQKYPHHEFDGENVILNTKGLAVATIFFSKPQNQKVLTDEEKVLIAKHLAKHYEELGKEVPASLQKFIDKKESFVDFDLSFDDLETVASKYGISVEALGSYLSVIEKLVSEMINDGFVDVEDKVEEILIKLDRSQLETLISLIDKFNVNVFKVLNGEQPESDAFNKEQVKEIDELKAKLNEAVETAVRYKEANEKLLKEMAAIKNTAEKLESLKKEKEVLEHKLGLLVNIYRKSEDFDETILNMVLEAADEKEITILKKLSESASNPKLRFNKLTGDDVDLLVSNKLKEKKESVRIKDYISDLL